MAPHPLCNTYGTHATHNTTRRRQHDDDDEAGVTAFDPDHFLDASRVLDALSFAIGLVKPLVGATTSILYFYKKLAKNNARSSHTKPRPSFTHATFDSARIDEMGSNARHMALRTTTQTRHRRAGAPHLTAIA